MPRIFTFIGQQISKGLKTALSKVPMLGILAWAPVEPRKKASEECTVLLLTAFSPVFMALMFLLMYEPSSIGVYWSSFIKRGELIIYAAAFLAPVGYLAWIASRSEDRDKQSRKTKVPFPEAGYSIITVFIFMIVSAMVTAGRILNKDPIDLINLMSYTMLLVAVMMNYVASVHKHFGDVDSGVDLLSGDDNLTRQLQELSDD